MGETGEEKLVKRHWLCGERTRFTPQTSPTRKWPERSRVTSTARRLRPQKPQTLRPHVPKISTAQPPQGRAGLHTLSRWPEGGGSGQSIRSQLVTPTELEATSVAQTVAAAKDAAITDHTETNYTNRNLTP